MTEDQSDTIRFLADPASHGGQPVERIDTHISHLFLLPDRVFKLKRAMRTNFLDFSTPERRRAMCEREITANAAAQALYRGVRAVTRAAGTLARDGGGELALDGEGEAVDHVVEMARFDRDSEFDRMAERGALTPALIEALADRVAALHATAPVHRAPGADRAQIDRIAQIADAVTETHPGLSRSVAAWRSAAQTACRDHARQIAARGRHGHVRRCHGDLHLGNICLSDGAPVPFDAIEFNEDIATTDVLYDSAFTVMDLLARGLTGLAASFTARYLSATRDHAGLALLPLFVSLRSAVRAIAEPADQAAQRLAMAQAVLAPLPPPRLVAVGGPSGSGKSTLARDLAPHLGGAFFAVVLRSDVARKRLHGLPPETPLPPEAYAPGHGARVYRRLRAEARRSLRAGFPVILDAAFLDAEERAGCETLAGRLGVAFDGLWLSAPAGTMADRIAARRDDASDATVSVLRHQLDGLTTPPGWHGVDTGCDTDAARAAALAALGVAD